MKFSWPAAVNRPILCTYTVLYWIGGTQSKNRLLALGAHDLVCKKRSERERDKNQVKKDTMPPSLNLPGLHKEWILKS